MLKTASITSFASRSFTGKNVKKLKKTYKKAKRLGATPAALKGHKKNIKRAKEQRMFVRGTALAGGAGGYYAYRKSTLDKQNEDNLIPKDY